MTFISMSMEKFIFGNENWRASYAADEIEIYSDVLEFLQERIESSKIRAKDEEVMLLNAQAVNGSYAFEIAIKSLWALDYPDDAVPRTHDLLQLFDGLAEDTVKALDLLQCTREVVERCPKPFLSNRYSMEQSDREFIVYEPPLLRAIAAMLREKTEKTRESLVGFNPVWS